MIVDIVHPGRANVAKSELQEDEDEDEDEDETVAVDLSRLAALMKLRESDFLLKEDRQYDLLCHACELECILRFDYLADWDPAALQECQT